MSILRPASEIAGGIATSQATVADQIPTESKALNQVLEEISPIVASPTGGFLTGPSCSLADFLGYNGLPLLLEVANFGLRHAQQARHRCRMLVMPQRFRSP